MNQEYDIDDSLRALLCCSSWGFRGFEYAAYFSAAANIGFQFVELQISRLVGSYCHLGPEPLHEELAARKDAAQEAGVRIAVIAGTNDFTLTDAAKLNAEIEFARSQIFAAKTLGARIVRLFSGWAAYEQLTEETYESTSRAIQKVGEYAAANGVFIAIENHGGMTGTAAQLRRLLDMVSLSNVGCTFDPANFARWREDPVAAYAILKQYVMYLQLKDLRWIDIEPQFCAIGEGGIQWNRLLDELSQNYTGYWGIEYEDPSDIMEGTRKCIKALVQFRKTLKLDQAQRSDSTHP